MNDNAGKYIFLLGAVAVGGVYYFYIRPMRARQAQSSAPPVVVLPPAPQAQPALSFGLEQSDDPVRQMANGLASDSKWTKWLGADNLVRRMTAAVTIIADGESPRASLGFL